MAKKETEPKTWTEEKKEIAIKEVLSKLSNGKSLRSILDLERDKELLPSRDVFRLWLKEDEDLQAQYVCACEDRQGKIFEDILDIADDSSDDSVVTENGNVVFNHEFAARSRIKIDARKWMLGKMNPKKYGERIQQDVTIKDAPPMFPDKAADEKE